MKKLFFIAFVPLICALQLYAQSSERMSEMIATEKATYGQVCYFVGTSIGIVADDDSLEEAFFIYKHSGLIKDGIKAEDPIPLKNIALIFMHTWQIEPSLAYKCFKNARYAFRSLKAQSIIPSGADPSKISTGHEVLYMMTDCVMRFNAYTPYIYLKRY